MADFGATGAIISAVVAVASTAASAYANVQAGKQQEKAYEYNAAVARNQAEAERAAGLSRADAERARAARTLAQTRARIARSGIEQEGSPLAVLLDSAAQAELDAARLVYGGNIRAGQLESEAGLQRYQGRIARAGGTSAAGRTILSGASSLAMSGMKYYGTQRSPGASSLNAGDFWEDYTI